MRNLLYFLILLFIVACSKEASTENSSLSFERALGVTASDSPVEAKSASLYADISYGSGTRNQLDIIMPEGDPKGVILFFHGGGFTGGSKEEAYDEALEETMEAILGENIVIVTANYTLLTTPGNKGVISALEDGALAINYIRSALVLTISSLF